MEKQKVVYKDNPTQEYDKEEIEKRYNNFYGQGIFRDDDGNWHVGDEQTLLNIPSINQRVAQSYNDIRTNNTKVLNELKGNVDFTTERSDTFNNSVFSPYHEDNKFNFLDYTHNFQNLTKDRTRLFAPITANSVYDNLGALNIEQNPIYLSGEDGKVKKVNVKIDRTTNKATAITDDGTEIDLGIYSDTPINQRQTWTNYKWKTSLDDDFGSVNVPLKDLSVAKSNVVGFGSKVMTPQNFTEFANLIRRNKFENPLKKSEAINLANTLLHYYNLFGKNLSKRSIEIIKEEITRLNSVGEEGIQTTHKKGAKYSSGGGTTLTKPEKSFNSSNKI